MVLFSTEMFVLLVELDCVESAFDQRAVMFMVTFWAGADWVTIPSAIFTDPEVASAGLDEAQAAAKGFEIRIGKVPFAAMGRAIAQNETEGFVKVIMDAKSERLLGVQIVGPEAADLISEVALAIEMGASVQDLALTVHPHPTLPEVVVEAAEAALGRAIHIANRK